jgi:hypothetical protein
MATVPDRPHHSENRAAGRFLRDEKSGIFNKYYAVKSKTISQPLGVPSFNALKWVY